MKKTIEIRIKRPRTDNGKSTLEILEKFASIEGRTLANALEQILNGAILGRWEKFHNDATVRR